MNGIVIGGAAGLAIALVALTFGVWGFLLALVLCLIGAAIGAIVSGRVDVRAVGDALRGRRSA